MEADLAPVLDIAHREVCEKNQGIGGEDGAWLNASGWNVSEYESAPDPCDGHSWFGIYRWDLDGGYRVRADACTEPDLASGAAPQLQVLSLTASASGAWFGNGLRGSLPSALGQLSALRVLLINDNLGLRGSIPGTLGQLTALQLLYLASNNLEGTIPSVRQLTRLRSLGMDQNRL